MSVGRAIRTVGTQGSKSGAPAEPRGRFDRHIVHSEALLGNVLDDPVDRPLVVYVPPAVTQDSDRRYPVLYLLHAMGNSLDSWWNRSAFRATVPELVDRIFGDRARTMFVVFVDGWTSVGGSQYLNSPGTGHYLDYLCDDVIGFVDAHYLTIPSAEGRAVAGHSSGGYGAMVAPMMRPGVFGALATHSGDSLFEYSYIPDIASASRSLKYEYNNSYEAFWTDFNSRPAFTRSSDGPLQNVWAMAACYSANPDGSVLLPFDPQSLRLRPDVWARWLELDPVNLIVEHADALAGLRGIWIDAGRRDEFNLDLGAVSMSQQLETLGINHRLDLHEGGHSRIEYVYPRAWQYLADCLEQE